MAKRSMSMRIERAAEDVFDYVADVENNPRWRGPVVETTWLDDGPTAIGRRGRQVSRVMGRSYEVIAEVVVWDPPRRVAWATTAGAADVLTECRVEPNGDGCVFTIETEGTFTGRFWKLLTPLAVAMIGRQAGADLKSLKSILEDGAEPAS